LALEAWLADPRFQSTVVPFAVAALTTALVRAAAGARGDAWAGLAVIAGVAAAYALILGPPPFPPRASTHKIAYIGVAAGLVGLALDLARARPPLVRLAVASGALAAALWLIGPRLDVGDPMGLLWPALPVLAVWLILALRLEAQTGAGLAAPVALAVAAAGLSLVALYGRSASIAQLAAALAAAVAGYALWNWPVQRMALARAAVLAAGSLLLGLATQSLLFTKAQAAALALLLLALFADRPAAWLLARLVPPPGRLGKALAPLVLALVAALPAAGAVAIAWLAAGPGRPF
jgi:hypothetical protein